MTACQIFISYSHADAWLKDELISHFGALKRNDLVNVWHDRCIPAGGLLADQIDENLNLSDLCIFLVSADFINSDYCIHKEYERAVARRNAGETEIVPIIIRPCDWDTAGLRKFKALPLDGIPVTSGADSKLDKHQRDPKWLEVIDGIKGVLEHIKKKAQPPKVHDTYHDKIFRVDYIRHPSLAQFDERLIIVDPDIYYESEKEQISTFDRLVEICEKEQAALITGADRSGKSVVAKKLHVLLAATNNPAILLNGKKIRNKDIKKIIASARTEQFATSEMPIKRFRVIIDDFDECSLPDQIKESIVRDICETCKSCVLFSFSNAPSILFTSNGLPSPAVFLINPVNDAKIYTIVQKWASIGLGAGIVAADEKVLPLFEKIQLVFEQTGLEKSPHIAATFLQFIDTISGADISFSSYAACYDILIGTRLTQAKVQVQGHDEARNFLSLVAYRAYVESGSACIKTESFDNCLTTFEEQFLSSKSSLRQMAVGDFLHEEDGYLEFHEEYLWFFLCARYVVKTLAVHDAKKYVEFVEECTLNIFQRKFANIVIYIAYFSADKLVLESLLQTLDGLFAKASEWVISDDTRELMMGLINNDSLVIASSQEDAKENRMTLLQEKIADIISDAEKVVARYTLPFLNPRIGDASKDQALDVRIDSDSYMQSVNALLRTHSVIGQILSARSGTFTATLVLDCITRMVMASGRYVTLNHAIAAVLMYDKDFSVEELKKEFKESSLTPEEKYEKVTRIFAFWSVYLSHAGLARYLSQEHSIRALDKLVEKYESEDSKTKLGNVPFNFTFVRTVARLYSSGRIDRKEIDGIVQKYGESSAVMQLLRVVVHMYAYYMPLEIEDKQWVSQRLRMPIRKIEIQRLKALTKGGRAEKAIKEVMK